MSITRKALKDFTFSDGTFIPKGTLIGVASRGLHHDEQFYESANVFKPFRFAGIREMDGEGLKYQFVSTGLEYLPFGHGRHAWYEVFTLTLSLTESWISDYPLVLDASLLQTS